jgi:uncharacterized protein YndB with AHSA1/START domain
MTDELAFELSVDIDAAPERVWSVMMDLERWPEWTPSVSRIQRLDPGELAAGKAVRIWQPGLVRAVWRVTELVPGQRFTWVFRSFGLRSTGIHRVGRRGNGARATLGVRHEGLALRLLRGWISGVTQRYVTMEAQGLKACCERS